MDLEISQIAAPSLRNYFSATHFLNDLFAYRKSIDPAFSYENLSAELGLESRSFLKMVVSRQKVLNPKFVDQFSKGLGFDDSEREYFKLMVSHDQADSASEKSHYLDKIFEKFGTITERTEIQNHREFLSSPLLPKLQVMLGFDDVEKTPANLGKILNASSEEILSALQKLQKLGLAVKNDSWETTKKSYQVPKNICTAAVEQYHNNSLKEATEAQKLPADVRRFRSLLIPLGETEYKNLVNDIEELIARTMAKYDSDSFAGKHLYKVNVNLFPVTESIASAEEAVHSKLGNPS